MAAIPKPSQDNEATVFVIDDDAGVRASLQTLLRSVGLRVNTFGSTDEFLAGRMPDAPSCIVLDVRLPGVSGLDFQAKLIQSSIQIPVIFITGHGDIPMTVRAMKAGAVEFLPKPFRDQDLLDAVQVGLDRDRVRRENDRATANLMSAYQTLTAREQQVMALVTSGLMNKQVAADIGVSEVTVKVHRGNVMHKMGAKSFADLVRMADTLGIRQTKP
ncbi:response regulator transcription factor [Rhodoplanes sp. Z2-YC6860]|uniref:response regulator transcription factor n=1 Tax=Rhodoplanes sp. Z2-YC6860 TaxID=674703 RepID=UPI00078D9782|nr:response regulator transcription factor [Rhodoplanes sp. Z2-YC6860]AMN41998.1 LuxR family transcriptional regulator [Rhodoplanes sp. Z2-YC6860]